MFFIAGKNPFIQPKQFDETEGPLFSAVYNEYEITHYEVYSRKKNVWVGRRRKEIKDLALDISSPTIIRRQT